MEVVSNLPDASKCLEIANKLQGLGKYEEDKALMAYQVNAATYKQLRIKSYTDVFTTKTSTITGLRKYRGDELCAEWLKNRFLILSKQFKVGNPLTDDDLDLLVDVFFDDYHYFTIADFKKFSKMAVSGSFGTAYNRLDVPTLLQWLNNYKEMRFNQAQVYSQTKHKREIVSSNDPIKLPDHIIELAKKLEPKGQSAEISYEEAKKSFSYFWEIEFKKLKEQKPNQELRFEAYMKLQYQKLLK